MPIAASAITAPHLFLARGAPPPLAPPCGARGLALLGRTIYSLLAGPHPRSLRPAALEDSLSSGGRSTPCSRGPTPARSALRRSRTRSPRADDLFLARGAHPRPSASSGRAELVEARSLRP